MAGIRKLDDDDLRNVTGGYGYFSTRIDGEGGSDTLDGRGEIFVAGMSGGGGDDLIYDSNDRQVLHGDAGNDTIISEDGNDTLLGDAGNDLLTIYLDRSDSLHFVRGGTGTDTLRLDIASPDQLKLELSDGTKVTPQLVDGNWTYNLPPESKGSITITSPYGEKHSIRIDGLERIELRPR